MVSVLAPAKVNLCLHITGQRDEGYHMIDSVVGFGPVADELHFAPADTLTMQVGGPEAAGVSADMSNLALAATNILADGRGATVSLTKNLPVASGIGGGSADAAAAFRAGLAIWGPGDNPDQHADRLTALGADIPMCLSSAPVRARGIGDQLQPLPNLPALPIILANPRVPLSTREVFANLKSRDNPGLPDMLPRWFGVDDFTEWLKGTRNDLETPAIELQPMVGEVRDTLAATDGALIARMSGSGATCFAIFASGEAAQAAGQRLMKEKPYWWFAGGWMKDCTQAVMPKASRST